MLASWVATLLSSLGLYSEPAVEVVAIPANNPYLTPIKTPKHDNEDDCASSVSALSSQDHKEEDFAQLLCKLETKFAQRRLRLSSSGGKAKRLRVSLPSAVPFRNA